MRKSGLQKQIAFIFDEVPMPQADPASAGLPVLQQAEDNVNPDCPQEASSSRQDSTGRSCETSSTQPMAATQVAAVHTPVVSTLRPKPLPRMKVVALKQKTSQLVIQQVKKVLYGSSKHQMDPRQKKMTLLVGVLSLVFAVVLVVSLGGFGKGSAKAAGQQEAVQDTQQAQQANARQWQSPQPLPDQLRNPMIPQAGHSGRDANTSAGGPMVVKGIVFSEDNPSAIINSQIVKQGETINGTKVIAISKDAVEFEKDGKRWIQQVQR